MAQIHAALSGQRFVVLVHPDAAERTASDPAVYRKVFALSGNPVEPTVLEQAGIDRALRVIAETGKETSFDFVAAKGYLGGLREPIPAKDITKLVIERIRKCEPEVRN